MFESHHLIKVGNGNWVFDITDFVGYKVTLDKNKQVKSFKEAFTVIELDEELEFDNNIKVPLRVIREVVDYIDKYKEQCLEK